MAKITIKMVNNIASVFVICFLLRCVFLDLGIPKFLKFLSHRIDTTNYNARGPSTYDVRICYSISYKITENRELPKKRL